MATDRRYTEYTSYPGRQITYTVIPRRYEPVFFEGVQSVDAATNADEVNHGQFGFKGDVIITRDYQNTSGTFSLKDFNNASYVLRAMTGVSPNNSFIFDASRLEHVDVICNVMNKERDRVVRSSWFVDFTPSLTENESLDDIQTKDIAYTAIRKIDFEGKQIVVQSFTDTHKDDFEFTLKWKAVIDPTVQTSEFDATKGTTYGVGRHDLCPIPWLLRVWVDGTVLENADDATVGTTSDGSGNLTSTVVLKTPLAVDGQIVKVMWLAEGDDPVAVEGVTSAPVMVFGKPNVDTAPATNAFLGQVEVSISSRLAPAAVTALTTLANYGDFVLTFENGGITYTMSPTAITSNIGLVTTSGAVVSDNVLNLDFTSSVVNPSGGVYSAGDPATLTYNGVNMYDPDGYIAPSHTIELPDWSGWA